MGKKQIVALVYSICLALMLAAISVTGACAPKPAPVPAPVPEPIEVIKWRMQTVVPFTDFQVVFADEPWARLIEERSGGRIEITLYPPGGLSSVDEAFDSLGVGMYEAGCIPASYFSGIMPEGDIEFCTPFFQRETYDYYIPSQEMGIADLMREAYAEYNVHYDAFSTVPQGGMVFALSKPIETIDDVKGMKIRAFGSMAKLMAHLGAATTFIPGGELYMASKLGTVEGLIYGSTGYEPLKFYEVAPYIIHPWMDRGATVSLLLNMDAWKQLSDDLKDVVAWSTQSIWISHRLHMQHRVYSGLNALRDKGLVTFITLPDESVTKMSAAASKVWDEMAEANPRSAKIMGIIKDYARGEGYLE